MTLDITTTASDTPRSDDQVAEILANPGFGIHFTDHMLTLEWTPEQGWHDGRITKYGPLAWTRRPPYCTTRRRPSRG